MTGTIQERPGFERRMTADEINGLPVRRYEGPVRLVQTREELAEAITELSGERVLGFDTETRPSFSKGEVYPPALVQLAGRGAVYVLQLRHLKLPPGLRDLLANPRIIKAGVAAERDVAELKRVSHFQEDGFVDLAEQAKALGIKNHGLRGLAAVLLGFRISKRAQKTNWARHMLTPVQVEYAATDAWVSRELYFALKRFAGRVARGEGRGGHSPGSSAPEDHSDGQS